MTFVRPLAALLLAGTFCIGQERTPLLVVPGVENPPAVEQWNRAAAEIHWKLAMPTGDLSPQALERAVQAAVAKGGVDEDRVYLLGLPDLAPVTLYAASRFPHLWAGVAIIHGNLKGLVQSNHLFAANSRPLPAAWFLPAGEEKGQEWSITRLKQAGFRLEVKPVANLTAVEPLRWLSAQRRNPAPHQVECESGAPVFRSCYWLEMGEFDQAQRNDVLKSSRVEPGSGASLDLGGFGYSQSDPGPGLLVVWLPDNYAGPLKKDDRILQLGSKQIENAAAYAQMMEQAVEDRPISVTVLREKSRKRIETRIVLPKREEVWTAAIRGEFNPATRELLVVSRGLTAPRLNLPAAFLPAKVNWNGTVQGELTQAGCYVLGASATPCPPKAPAPAKGPSAPPSLRRPSLLSPPSR
jgi:hypothetical protein